MPQSNYVKENNSHADILYACILESVQRGMQESEVETDPYQVHKRRQKFRRWEESTKTQKLPMDRCKKVLTWGRGVLKIWKELPTSFMDSIPK